MAHDEQADLSRRLEDLEVRYSHLERLIAELDTVLRETADEMVELRRVVKLLEQRAIAEADEIQHQGLQAEKPPHY